MKLIVNEVFKVKILQNRNYLLSKHEDSLGRETTLSEADEVFERSIKFLEYNKVVVLLLATPMHVWDTCSSLHNL